MENPIQHLKSTLNWAFIDHQQDSLDQYKPRLLVNNKETSDFVLTPLLDELDRWSLYFFRCFYYSKLNLPCLSTGS